MTIRELIDELEKYDDKYEVVLCVSGDQCEGLDSAAFAIESIDNGWEPSGVISLGAGEFLMG